MIIQKITAKFGWDQVMEKIDDDNNVEESTGKKHLSLKLDGESMEFDLQIDDFRTDAIGIYLV